MSCRPGIPWQDALQQRLEVRCRERLCFAKLEVGVHGLERLRVDLHEVIAQIGLKRKGGD